MRENFEKKDLRTGMVVEFKNGDKNLVLCGNMQTTNYDIQDIMLITNSDFMNGSSYNEKLLCDGDLNSSFTIMKVYEPNVSTLKDTIDKCSESNLIWERQDEIDWSSVEVDTKILVRMDNSQDWKKRYFAKFLNGMVYTYNNGTTSFTSNYEFDITSWNYAKLAD